MFTFFSQMPVRKGDFVETEKKVSLARTGYYHRKRGQLVVEGNQTWALHQFYLGVSL